jgi:hypothetical protein
MGGAVPTWRRNHCAEEKLVQKIRTISKKSTNIKSFASAQNHSFSSLPFVTPSQHQLTMHNVIEFLLYSYGTTFVAYLPATTSLSLSVVSVSVSKLARPVVSLSR